LSNCFKSSALTFEDICIAEYEKGIKEWIPLDL
jgi:hypothetical protein